ncbi:MAG TPA: hypothetical protein VHA30_03675 [Patescibacteria group bacterium]|nr:hypothetical protein [Patescibacteria group bacterium]
MENFSQTFFVGGMVRDLLLGRRVTDIDIATAAHPGRIASILASHDIAADSSHRAFGVVTARAGNAEAEITTFRRDAYGDSRYPKVRFIKSPGQDAKRRDFTVNSLYLSLKTNSILDFHNGLGDIKSKTIRFIGAPDKRIAEDPLRMIRALRFASDLGFHLERKTFFGIKNNFSLLKKISHGRIASELERCKRPSSRKKINSALDSPEALDKYFLKP